MFNFWVLCSFCNLLHLFRPTSKKEEDDFNSKNNNWRGGF